MQCISFHTSMFFVHACIWVGMSTQHWNIFHDQMISHKIEFLPFMLWINYYVCMNDGIAKDLQALTSVLWSVKIKCLSLTWVVIYKINVKKNNNIKKSLFVLQHCRSCSSSCCIVYEYLMMMAILMRCAACVWTQVHRFINEWLKYF